jgi:hypothetical protein
MKKGTTIVPEWLIKLVMEVLEILAVVLIIAGIGYVIWQAQKDPQDQDFKRVLDATAKLLNDYDDGKIHGKEEITVPIVSKDPLDIAFYPDGGGESKCKNKPCLCMYHSTSDGSKTTCKIINIASKCTTAECGGALCSGLYYPPTRESKGGAVTVKIECTTAGSQFIVT